MLKVFLCVVKIEMQISMQLAWICVGDIFRENEDAGVPDFYFLEL